MWGAEELQKNLRHGRGFKLMLYTELHIKHIAFICQI